MRITVFAVILLSLLIYVILPGKASCATYPEHSKYTPYPSREEVHRGDLRLTEKITSLRESFVNGWYQTSSILLSVLTLVVTIGMAIVVVLGYVSISNIWNLEKKAEDSLKKTQEYEKEANQSKETLTGLFGRERRRPEVLR